MANERNSIDDKVREELKKAEPHVKKMLENGGYGVISLTFHQASITYIDENIKFKLDK